MSEATTEEDYYQILGAPRNASMTNIKHFYFIKALRYHPDRAGNTPENVKKFQKLVHVYQVLSDPVSKQYYDANGEPPPNLSYEDEEKMAEDIEEVIDEDEPLTKAARKAKEKEERRRKSNGKNKSKKKGKEEKSKVIVQQTAINGAWHADIPILPIIAFNVKTLERKFKEAIDKKVDTFFLESKVIHVLPRVDYSRLIVNKIDLTGNLLQVLPRTFSELPNLSVLILNGNRFKSFPLPLLGLERLQYLDLSFNKIDAVPEEISSLQYLQVLLLKGNCLSGLPRSLCEMGNLATLNILYNMILKIPAALTQIQQFVYDERINGTVKVQIVYDEDDTDDGYEVAPKKKRLRKA